jgi:hypothetical protein
MYIKATVIAAIPTPLLVITATVAGAIATPPDTSRSVCAPRP